MSGINYQKEIGLLWEEIRLRGDRPSFDRLYALLWERLFQIARVRMQDDSVAQDLVQDVFVSLWEKRTQIRVRESVTQYLIGALRYRLLDYFQDQKTTRSVLEAAGRSIHYQQQPREFHLSHEQVERIFVEELQKMPLNMRRSISMSMERHSIRTIAHTLDLADQTVNNLVSEARDRLRKTLPSRFSAT